MGGLNKWQEADVREVVKDFLACCYSGKFGSTTLSPPVDPPGDGDPLWVGNNTTGEIWHWDGNSWEPFGGSGGGGTTYFGVTLLSPPVAAPAGDVKWLGNPDTNEIWAWDGAAWVEFVTANIFGATTDNPPVAAPTGDDPKWLGNRTVNKIWSWNGSAWVEFLFDDSNVVHKTGAESVGGVKTFTDDPIVPDEAYGGSWDGSLEPPTKNAVYDEMETKADDSAVVHNTGNENVGGVKTFTDDPIIPDEAYGPSWDGSLEPPTKNAVYDEMELKADLTNLDNLRLDQFGITIDGGGSVIATGTKGFVRIPYSGVITGWTIIEASETPISSSIVVDIWKDTYANYPPTNADTVFTDKPTISGSTKGQNNAPAILLPNVTAGDMIGYEVESVTDAVKVVVHIHITKSI